MTRLPLMTRPPDEMIIHSAGQVITLSRFLYQASVLAEQFCQQLPDQCYIINLCHNRYLFSLAFAAAIIAERTTLLPANRLPDTVNALLQAYPNSVPVSEHALPEVQRSTVDPSAVLDLVGEVNHIPQIDPDGLAAVVFTSGSTGAASRIHKTWATLYYSSLVNAAEYGPQYHHPTHIVATVPPQHMWGLETSVLLPWFSPTVIGSSQPFFAADILNELRPLPRPRALVSTPVHLRALVESDAMLIPMDRIYSATAPLSMALAQRLEASTGAQITEVYGCSEAGCLAWREPIRDPRWQLFACFALSQQGQMSTISAAHLPEPVTLMDYLHVDAEGRFNLAGRHSDLVNIAGKRASLQELTQVLLDIEGVIDGVIFQPEEHSDGAVQRLAALVVAPGMTASEIRQALSRRIDPAFMPRPLRLVPALPRIDSGKLPRQSLLHFFNQVCESSV